ncbi:MAG: hypothetical protein AAF242_16365 [Bacteroidota bacterium]
MQILIKDETYTGEVLHTQEIDFDMAQVTVKDIIAERVKQEVERHNKKKSFSFQGLVQPKTEKQRLIWKKNAFTPVDAEQQIYVALDAFQNNGFFVIIDQNQAESLDQVVELRAGMEVSFLKLTPLVGG